MNKVLIIFISVVILFKTPFLRADQENGALKRSVALKRISPDVVFNTGEVHYEYISFGRGTVIMTYCPVQTARPGMQSDLTAEIDKKDPTKVWINLAKPTAKVTNVFIVCQDEFPMVFEFIPSNTKHRDVIPVRASYRAGGSQGVSMVEIPPESVILGGKKP